MIVADASWIIALRDPTDAHHRAAVEVADDIGDERGLLPAVTLAECLVAPARMGKLDMASEELRAAFDVIETDPVAPERWTVLRAETGLRLPGAIVLDAALRHRARAITTFDAGLAACATERRIGRATEAARESYGRPCPLNKMSPPMNTPKVGSHQ